MLLVIILIALSLVSISSLSRSSRSISSLTRSSISRSSISSISRSSLSRSSLSRSSLSRSSISSSSLTRLAVKGGSSGGGILPKDKITNTLTYYGMDKELGNNIVLKAEKALKSWSTEYTEFLDPIELKSLVEGFKDLLDVQLSFQGGFTQSIRKRCFINRNDNYIDIIDEDNNNDNDDESNKALSLKLNEYNDNIEQYIAAIKIEGNFLFDRATYDDFQTAIMTTGVSKNQIGDIILLPNDKGAQVIITPDVTLNIINSLKVQNVVEFSHLLGLYFYQF
jgi:hypothetical protein